MSRCVRDDSRGSLSEERPVLEMPSGNRELRRIKLRVPPQDQDGLLRMKVAQITFSSNEWFPGGLPTDLYVGSHFHERVLRALDYREKNGILKIDDVVLEHYLYDEDFYPRLESGNFTVYMIEEGERLSEVVLRQRSWHNGPLSAGSSINYCSPSGTVIFSRNLWTA